MARDAQSILAERAAALARARVAREGRDGGRDLLVFAVAGERHAVEPDLAGEVVPVRRVSPLPGLPGHVRGVIPVHGRVVALLDLPALLGMAGGAAPAYAVVLRDAGMEFALGAEEILGFARVPAGDIARPPATFDGRRRDYAKGVAPGPVLVLDAAAMLADQGLVVEQS